MKHVQIDFMCLLICKRLNSRETLIYLPFYTQGIIYFRKYVLELNVKRIFLIDVKLNRSVNFRIKNCILTKSTLIVSHASAENGRRSLSVYLTIVNQNNSALKCLLERKSPSNCQYSQIHTCVFRKRYDLYCVRRLNNFKNVKGKSIKIDTQE